MSRIRPIGVTNLPSMIHASYDLRDIRSETAPIGVINLPDTIHTRDMIRAMYDPRPPARGDTAASNDTRKLRYTRELIRNPLLGVINLLDVIRASYDPRELRSESAFSGG